MNPTLIQMKTTCPSCQQPIEAEDQWSGMVVNCPTCSKEFTLPGILIPQPPPLPSKYVPSNGSDTILRRKFTFKMGVLRTVQMVVVGAALLGGLWIWKGSGHIVTMTAADGTKIQVDVGAIESLLNQDVTTTEQFTTVGWVVAKMKAIDTSKCPTDFQAAYLAHIHAWEDMAVIEQRNDEFKAASGSADAFVESFVRGFLGDPLGKANEEIQTQNQLEADAKAASDEIRQTFNHVEELATYYGAKLPPKDRQ